MYETQSPSTLHFWKVTLIPNFQTLQQWLSIVVQGLSEYAAMLSCIEQTENFLNYSANQHVLHLQGKTSHFYFIFLSFDAMSYATSINSAQKHPVTHLISCFEKEKIVVCSTRDKRLCVLNVKNQITHPHKRLFYAKSCHNLTHKIRDI